MTGMALMAMHKVYCYAHHHKGKKSSNVNCTKKLSKTSIKGEGPKSQHSRNPQGLISR